MTDDSENEGLLFIPDEIEFIEPVDDEFLQELLDLIAKPVDPIPERWKGDGCVFILPRNPDA